MPPGGSTSALPSAVPALPPPADFDFLPPLHKLLSRLITTSAPPPAPTPTPQTKDDDGSIEVGQLVTKVGEVRTKINKARKAVLALPDVDRSTEDQEDEIEDLEARIARLTVALQKLGHPAGGAENEDTSMTG